jgi:hypothetical protein
MEAKADLHENGIVGLLSMPFGKCCETWTATKHGRRRFRALESLDAWILNRDTRQTMKIWTKYSCCFICRRRAGNLEVGKPKQEDWKFFSGTGVESRW